MYAVFCDDRKRTVTFHKSVTCRGLGRAEPHQAGDPRGVRRFDLEAEAEAFAERSRAAYRIGTIKRCRVCC